MPIWERGGEVGKKNLGWGTVESNMVKIIALQKGLASETTRMREGRRNAETGGTTLDATRQKEVLRMKSSFTKWCKMGVRLKGRNECGRIMTKCVKRV